MPPASGKIHTLPIKVLYSLNTSSQSYVTVLNDRQEVYVHPGSSTQAANGEDAIGSCYLKPTASGICYASPECIPNASKLDFSVYNLDPSLRPRASHAFSSGANAEDGSWTGKGFLSWALNEQGSGSTLVRGRLIQDEDFSSHSFNEQGGLEGLMAAATRAGRSDREKGWGLEVHISLKVLNPEGKEEFRGRREFEELLRHGSATGVGSTTANGTSPAAASSSTTAQHPNHPSSDAVRRPNHPPAQPLRANGSAPTNLANTHLHPGESSSSLRPSPVMARPPLPAQNSSAASSSRMSQPPSSFPPSSIPMVSSSSNGPIHSTSSHGQDPHSDHAHSSNSVSGPDRNQSNLPVPTSQSRTDRSREVTPPPMPRPKSPPPSTPSRRTLHDLLRSDGTMSPSLAKRLASNPMLLRLLKAVPSNASALSSLTPLNSGDDKPSPAVETPTPSSSSTVKTAVGPATGCSNCGATESELWRTKVMKDGATKKVCNACGLYFNKHKRMRPPELWNNHPESSPDKRTKLEHDPPVRSSPRRHRQTPSASFNTSHPPLPAPFESPRKRGRGSVASGSGKTPQPSPRMATRASAKLEASSGTTAAGMNLTNAMDGNMSNGNMSGNPGDNLFFPSMFGGVSDSHSPSNVNTGTSTVSGTTLATLDGGVGTGPGHGQAQGHGQGQGQGSGDAHNGVGMNGEAAGIAGGDVDIEALLSQIASSEAGGLDLDALFGNGPGGEGFMELLNAWEGEAKTEG